MLNVMVKIMTLMLKVVRRMAEIMIKVSTATMVRGCVNIGEVWCAALSTFAEAVGNF